MPPESTFTPYSTETVPAKYVAGYEGLIAGAHFEAGVGDRSLSGLYVSGTKAKPSFPRSDVVPPELFIPVNGVEYNLDDAIQSRWTKKLAAYGLRGGFSEIFVSKAGPHVPVVPAPYQHSFPIFASDDCLRIVSLLVQHDTIPLPPEILMKDPRLYGYMITRRVGESWVNTVISRSFPELNAVLSDLGDAEFITDIDDPDIPASNGFSSIFFTEALPDLPGTFSPASLGEIKYYTRGPQFYNWLAGGGEATKYLFETCDFSYIRSVTNSDSVYTGGDNDGVVDADHPVSARYFRQDLEIRNHFFVRRINTRTGETSLIVNKTSTIVRSIVRRAIVGSLPEIYTGLQFLASWLEAGELGTDENISETSVSNFGGYPHSIDAAGPDLWYLKLKKITLGSPNNANVFSGWDAPHDPGSIQAKTTGEKTLNTSIFKNGTLLIWTDDETISGFANANVPTSQHLILDGDFQFVFLHTKQNGSKILYKETSPGSGIFSSAAADDVSSVISFKYDGVHQYTATSRSGSFNLSVVVDGVEVLADEFLSNVAFAPLYDKGPGWVILTSSLGVEVLETYKLLKDEDTGEYSSEIIKTIQGPDEMRFEDTVITENIVFVPFSILPPISF